MEMAGVPAKLRTAVIVLLGLVIEGLLADLHCESLELLLLKIVLQGSTIKMSFAGSRNHTGFSRQRKGGLAVPVVARSKA